MKNDINDIFLRQVFTTCAVNSPLTRLKDPGVEQHASLCALLEAGHAASVTLYVTSQIICEFYSVVTDPRRVAKPYSPAEALAAISSLLVFCACYPCRRTRLRNFFACFVVDQ